MNIFFLAAALLMLFLSAAHAAWGETRLFKVLTPALVDGETFVSLYVPWHQITYLLAVSGLALLWCGFQDNPGSLPLFVFAVVIGNFSIFILICLVKRQTALFLLLIALISLGIIS